MEPVSNTKFGLFFSFVFLIATIYSYRQEFNIALTSTAAGLALIFSVVTLLRPATLLPINKLWMRLGYYLGLIISPIILGIIFFSLFHTTAVILRFIGRDELGLSFDKETSYWKRPIKSDLQPDKFENQY